MILYTPKGGLDTVLNRYKTNIVNIARIQLTLLYVSIVAVISLFFSTLTYNQIIKETNRGFKMHQTRLYSMQPGPANEPLQRKINQDQIEIRKQIKKRAITNLVILNSGILIISIGVGYYFAGLSLKPISKVMEKQKKFIANASHELKTPITSLKLENQVVLKNKNAKKEELVKTLKSNIEEIDKLEILVNKIINKSRMLEQQLPYTTVSNLLVCKLAIGKNQSAANQKHVSIVKHITTTKLKGNKDQIIELLSILIDNAIKFSYKNNKVLVKSYPKGKYVYFEIGNNGTIIKDKQKIFDRFYKEDESHTKSHKTGHGLGLSIAKEVVDLHNGKIQVTSSTKYNTIFKVQLPKQM